MATHLERTHLLEALLAGVKEAVAALPAGEAREALRALAEETERRKRRTDTDWWPMENLAAEDLGAALEARLRARAWRWPAIWVRQSCAATGSRSRGFWNGLRSTGRGRRAGAGIDARRDGTGGGRAQPRGRVAEVDEDAVAGWLAMPLSPGMTGFTGAAVARPWHDRDIRTRGSGPRRAALSPCRWPTRQDPPLARGALRFRPAERRDPRRPRRRALKDLSFVVFDTETTGLNPQVDEVCQIAAVRVVNGKLLDAERFDMLVNPGRKIPAASTAVHHITDEMVADAPGVAEAMARFHTFADGCVLVAHNAPFDMAFLRRREREIGRRFDQPILDTVLCSAILFGQSAEHTLDALCDRLSITIPEQDRHTAIGDAIGTADAFRKMIPMLEAAELPNLGALIKAFDRHSRLIEHLN
jgi:DNA polymerase-3 subunit epsilon